LPYKYGNLRTSVDGDPLKLNEGTGVTSRRINGWLPWALAVILLVSGCSGILLESKKGGGEVDRLKFDAAETWDSYDDRPRYRYSTTNKRGLPEELGIILKSEKTF
jgi:hypothetical protein